MILSFHALRVAIGLTGAPHYFAGGCLPQTLCTFVVGHEVSGTVT